MSYRIYFDAYHEGKWFQALHPELAAADLVAFPNNPAGKLGRVLSLDRPDIILELNNEPVLVLERTEEVPSGHNVGQRFARLLAAALAHVPCVYFGPYMAMKHGGDTSGPRYMNLRLFYAIDVVEGIEQSPITTIRWGTDAEDELLRTPDKDARMREYLRLFFELLPKASSVEDLAKTILVSDFEKEQEDERALFVRDEVARFSTYDSPPGTLQLGLGTNLEPELEATPYGATQIALYDVGMRNIRSDPYTGTALMYSYLYCGGLLHHKHCPLVLRFAHITKADWARTTIGLGASTKTIRLYTLAADAIVFQDGVVLRADL